MRAKLMNYHRLLSQEPRKRKKKNEPYCCFIISWTRLPSCRHGESLGAAIPRCCQNLCRSRRSVGSVAFYPLLRGTRRESQTDDQHPARDSCHQYRCTPCLGAGNGCPSCLCCWPQPWRILCAGCSRSTRVCRCAACGTRAWTLDARGGASRCWGDGRDLQLVF